MRLKKSIIILAVLFVLFAAVSPALAQSLLFQVTREEVDLYINEDGSATVSYLYVFANEPSGAVIDFVDVGVPNYNYSLSNVEASINDQPVDTIEESPYVKPGVAIGLGSRAI